NAERHPQHEIVIIAEGDGYGRRPELPAPDDRARIEPAQEYADDVGERIPADGDRPEADEHGVDRREGKGIKRHRATRATPGDAGSEPAKSSRCAGAMRKSAYHCFSALRLAHADGASRYQRRKVFAQFERPRRR